MMAQRFFDTSVDYERRNYEGYELTLDEIVGRIEYLSARGHDVHIEIHVDDPDHES